MRLPHTVNPIEVDQFMESIAQSPVVPAVLFQAFLCLRTEGICGS
jgi:hypothetical protein